jgi:hypothetical protein
MTTPLESGTHLVLEQVAGASENWFWRWSTSRTAPRGGGRRRPGGEIAPGQDGLSASTGRPALQVQVFI